MVAWLENGNSDKVGAEESDEEHEKEKSKKQPATKKQPPKKQPATKKQPPPKKQAPPKKQPPRKKADEMVDEPKDTEVIGIVAIEPSSHHPRATLAPPSHAAAAAADPIHPFWQGLCQVTDTKELKEFVPGGHIQWESGIDLNGALAFIPKNFFEQELLPEGHEKIIG